MQRGFVRPIVLGVVVLVVIAAGIFYFGKLSALIRGYRCPGSEWINCMPSIGQDAPPRQCGKEYLQWAKASCPNFKGPAY